MERVKDKSRPSDEERAYWEQRDAEMPDATETRTTCQSFGSIFGAVLLANLTAAIILWLVHFVLPH